MYLVLIYCTQFVHICVGGSQVQSCARQLTRLEMQPQWEWPWDLLPSMPRLRELSIGLSAASEQRCSMLTALRTLALGFSADCSPDLSVLTGLQRLSLFGCGEGQFTGILPASITYLCLRSAVKRCGRRMVTLMLALCRPSTKICSRPRGAL